jgi:hypothetical protein
LFIIDKEQRYLDIACRNIEYLGLSNIHVYPIHVKTSHPSVLSEIPAFVDLIFLDSEHSLFGVNEELDLYLPRISLDGCLGLHDLIT